MQNAARHTRTSLDAAVTAAENKLGEPLLLATQREDLLRSTTSDMMRVKTEIQLLRGEQTELAQTLPTLRDAVAMAESFGDVSAPQLFRRLQDGLGRLDEIDVSLAQLTRADEAAVQLRNQAASDLAGAPARALLDRISTRAADLPVAPARATASLADLDARLARAVSAHPPAPSARPSIVDAPRGTGASAGAGAVAAAQHDAFLAAQLASIMGTVRAPAPVAAAATEARTATQTLSASSVARAATPAATPGATPAATPAASRFDVSNLLTD